jgi:hypothetical protein
MSDISKEAEHFQVPTAREVAVASNFREYDYADALTITCHFYLSLINTMSRADEPNLRALCAAFPDYGRAMLEWSKDREAFYIRHGLE